MSDLGNVDTRIVGSIAEIHFSHPRGNSLPGSLLSRLAEEIRRTGKIPEVRVVVLRSEGEKAFCAGASFDELASIREVQSGHDFFMGFAKVILAIRDSPQFVVARVQGKAVGGGVGLISACDYALACNTASIRLSEYALGFGPFVISPAVERKIGLAAFGALTIDTEWRDAAWAKQVGLYADVFPTIASLDTAVSGLLSKLSLSNPEASKKIKQVLWNGTDHWPELLSKRAQMSADLLQTDFVRSAIQAARAKS